VLIFPSTFKNPVGAFRKCRLLIDLNEYTWTLLSYNDERFAFRPWMIGHFPDGVKPLAAICGVEYKSTTLMALFCEDSETVGSKVIRYCLCGERNTSLPMNLNWI
jgi:hypothetical protein